MQQRSGELGTIARRWFDVIRDCGDDVRELLHDGHPTACVGDAAFAYVNAFAAHVNVGFFSWRRDRGSCGFAGREGKAHAPREAQAWRNVDVPALRRLIDAAYADMKDRLSTR
jgi:hypothetical protein